MNNFFKSFLIALLFAVGTIQAAAQAYPITKKMSDNGAISLQMKSFANLDANSPNVSLSLDYFPQTTRRLFFGMTLTKAFEPSVVNSIARLARQLPKEFSEEVCFKRLAYCLSLANGTKFEGEGTINITQALQALNYNNTTPNGDNMSATIIFLFEAAPDDKEVLSKLSRSNIVKLEIGGETFTFNGLRSADTFREMLEGLGLSVQNSTNITASVEKVWVDHNVFENGVKGMRIHVKFNINGMLNKTGRANAYFYLNNGNALKDYNNNFYTTDGNVAATRNFTPNYERCTFHDLTIFMPYSELELSQPAKCYFYVEIFDDNTQSRAISDKFYFDYNR